MNSVTNYLKTHWLRLILLLLATSVVVVIIHRELRQSTQSAVLPGLLEPDSVRSAPTAPEQSAQDRWDSLQTKQP